ncbi:hypothetical protein LTR36_006235 [Oleoguttula mirabilis]|uniref:Uncharacterized protein n=1 Tax=Oleoguttula mirabilis TaxID=1507867 RepID=A0AAV9JCY8_9PEZI|nr:hypothetical protein LTR36_006235 [Oleoguttula mirabilis]
MEQNEHLQRQYAPNTYGAQQPQPSSSQLPSQYSAPTSNERFRHPSFLQHSPTAPVPAGRAGNDAQQAYGFPQSAQYGAVSALPSSALQYGQTVDTQGAQRQQQQAQYQSYGNSVMYGMGQPQTQQQAQPTQSAYEQVPQYRHRPSPASETLVPQFGVPQTAQYYLAGQAGPTSAPASEMAAQHIPAQYQQSAYPQPGPSGSQPYPGIMMDPSQPGGYATYAQQPQYNPQPPAQSDQAFNDYQSRVRSIFLLVRDGTLRDIGTHLLYISQYLLGNVHGLGLARDDDALHDNRIRLWDEFNRAWLTTLQRQIEMTEEMIQDNQPPREPQSILSAQTLEHLSRELVRLCDNVEQHGLVDYQMGVAEEEIMDREFRSSPSCAWLAS